MLGRVQWVDGVDGGVGGGLAAPVTKRSGRSTVMA